MQANFVIDALGSVPRAPALLHGVAPVSNDQVIRIDPQRRRDTLQHIDGAAIISSIMNTNGATAI